MGNITIGVKGFKEILDIMPERANIMLSGLHGIGKSEILTSYFQSKGMKVTTLFLGQMSDPGDIIGLPKINEQTGRMDFTPPYWWPQNDEPIILFLDELNRARQEILQVVMDMVLNRRLAGRALPEGSRIISAVNEGDRYQLTDLDPALVSRFAVMHFKPTVQEWLLWAQGAGVDKRVMEFIENDSAWLDGDPSVNSDDDSGLDKSPDRRAWKLVSDILKGRGEITEAVRTAIASVVGVRATVAFENSVGSKKILGAKKVLKDFDASKTTLDGYDLKELSTVTDSIFRLLETEKVPQHAEAVIAQNLEKYFDFLSKGHKECAAYFCSQYTGGQFQNAVKFIVSKAKTLWMTLNIYIKSINQ